jgi:hypothetical protein
VFVVIIPYRERLTLTATGASHILTTSSVRHGYKRTIERILIANKTAARGKVDIYLGGYGYKHYVYPTLPLSQDWRHFLTSDLTLREEETLEIALNGLTAGDEIEVLLTGYDEPLMSV